MKFPKIISKDSEKIEEDILKLLECCSLKFLFLFDFVCHLRSFVCFFKHKLLIFHIFHRSKKKSWKMFIQFHAWKKISEETQNFKTKFLLKKKETEKKKKLHNTNFHSGKDFRFSHFFFFFFFLGEKTFVRFIYFFSG